MERGTFDRYGVESSLSGTSPRADKGIRINVVAPVAIFTHHLERAQPIG
jgi:hypothetical protein